jgi:uncharacterized membrane protein
VSAGISIAFILSAVLALLGRVRWLLTVVWAAAVSAIFVLVVISGADLSIMKGGLALFVMMAYLISGLLLSLGWLRQKPGSALEKR